jgi:hypothetical protein
MDNSSLSFENQLNSYQGFRHSVLYLDSHRYPMGGRGISESVPYPFSQNYETLCTVFRTKSTFVLRDAADQFYTVSVNRIVS